MKLLYPFGILESSRSGMDLLLKVADDRNDGSAAYTYGYCSIRYRNWQRCGGYCWRDGSSPWLVCWTDLCIVGFINETDDCNMIITSFALIQLLNYNLFQMSCPWSMILYTSQSFFRAVIFGSTLHNGRALELTTNTEIRLLVFWMLQWTTGHQSIENRSPKAVKKISLPRRLSSARIRLRCLDSVHHHWKVRRGVNVTERRKALTV